MKRLRYALARRLRRLSDRLAGQVRQEIRVQLTADVGEYHRAIARAEQALDRATGPWPYAHLRGRDGCYGIEPPPQDGPPAHSVGQL